MFIMYVDESGDPGITNSPTRYFVLSGIIIHELRWKQFLNEVTLLRRNLKLAFSLKIRDEIHASEFVNGTSTKTGILRNNRVQILKKCIDFLSAQADISIITVRIDKTGRTDDIFELAWSTLIQRFENTISHKNFHGPSNADERGIIISDNTDGNKLTKLVRKKRHFNPVPNAISLYGGGFRNLAWNLIVEDPFFKDSKKSNITQLVDVVAYFATQKYAPNKYIRKKAAAAYYNKLGASLLLAASPRHPQGIVEL